MLQTVKYYADYVQAIVSYTQKCVSLVVSTINNWPVWEPPIKTQENQQDSIQPN